MLLLLTPFVLLRMPTDILRARCNIPVVMRGLDRYSGLSAQEIEQRILLTSDERMDHRGASDKTIEHVESTAYKGVGGHREVGFADGRDAVTAARIREDHGSGGGVAWRLNSATFANLEDAVNVNNNNKPD